MDKILAAAKFIATARRSRAKLDAPPADFIPASEAEGYQVQRALHDLLRPQVGSLVGYKIGCTSKVMQEYLEIPHPCGGGVFEKGVHESGVKLAASDYVRVGVECEIQRSSRATCRPANSRSRRNGWARRWRRISPRSRSSTTAM